MSNPWPTSPTILYDPAQPQSIGAWPLPPQQTAPTMPQLNVKMQKQNALTSVLVQWDKAKAELAAAKDREMELRKQAFALGFGDDAKEGTNTLALENGYKLKGVKKLNYELVAPEGYKGDRVDAVQLCADKFAELSNEGMFVADRLFKWEVDLSISEYRELVKEADYSPIKKQMLAELNKVLLITEAAPTLEIKESKRKK